MITADYVRTMSAYNAEMNRRIYGAASRLNDEERRRDRGAFWTSIHGTLSHLLWADRGWMARFDTRWAAPEHGLADSGTAYRDFDAMAATRVEVDSGIAAWAATLDDDWISQDLTWWSGAGDRQMEAPRALLLTHLFNHQTHHRGQVHAMLTAAGEQTDGTDLPFVIER